MEQSIDLNRAGWKEMATGRWLAARWPLVLLGGLLLLATGSRFWNLGQMALHHDESLHAVYSWYEYHHGGYTHDPLMHGPLLFHLTALGYWLFGVTDATARLVPALLGIALVWAPWKFRDWLGTRGALITSALILISPTLLYYSRFIRHDIFLAVWTVIIVYGMWRYLQRGEEFHLYLMTAGWALAYSEKEVSYLLTMVFWTFLAVVAGFRALRARAETRWAELREAREWHLLVLIGALALPHTAALFLHLFGMDPAGGYTATAYRNPTFLVQAAAVVLLLFGIGGLTASLLWNGRKFLIAAGIFYTIFILLHTNFLVWPWGIGSGMVGALGYWIEQHDVQRGDQPWFYYTMLVPLYEFLPLFVGVIGGSILLWRRKREPLLVSTGEKHAQVDSRALWPYFNLWWFALLFVVLSMAGEKMPWLLVHLALPLAFMAGWALDRFLQGTSWQDSRPATLLVLALLVAVAFLSFVSLAAMAFSSEWPFSGSDLDALALTTRWIAGFLILGGAAWGIGRLRAEVGGEGAVRVALLVVTLLLALATVRFAYIAAFRNADVANEPLIYTQTSPDVPMVMREIETISRRMTGGKELQIAYDSGVTWPFEWYLRDYPNRFLYGASPSSHVDQIRAAPVVLASQDNNQQVETFIPDYIKHHYSMRPNFPEDYKKLIDVVQWQEDATNPERQIRVVTGKSAGLLNVLRNLWHYATQPQARADFVDFLWERRVKNPLGVYDFYVYVKPEVAAEVWQYGLTVATMDPALTRDPFSDATITLPASTVITGAFRQPRDLAILPDGQIVVADSGNHMIRIVTTDGTVTSEFGGLGSEPGQFNEPWGVAAAPDGTIYVSDTWNHRIQHLTTEGEVLHVWGMNGDTGGQLVDPGVFYGPRGIAVDEEGNVYVADTGNKRIQIFDSEGTFLDQFGGGGVEPGQFAEPVGVDIAPDGTIWVADTWNQRIQGFTPDHTPLAQIPLRTWDGQSISNKPYIEAGEERLWVSDPEAARIIELSRDGSVQRVWGQFGSDQNGLNLPYGMTAGEETLWVADSENQRILGFPK